MFGHLTSPADLAGTVQVALTSVFFLTTIAALLNVFSTRPGRVADHVDRMDQGTRDGRCNPVSALDGATRAYLRRRSHLLDAAVVLATVTGSQFAVQASLYLLERFGNRLQRRSQYFYSVQGSSVRSARSPFFLSKCWWQAGA
jgi:hypothetical protein